MTTAIAPTTPPPARRLVDLLARAATQSDGRLVRATIDAALFTYSPTDALELVVIPALDAIERRSARRLVALALAA
jgi:hypothetical protein